MYIQLKLADLTFLLLNFLLKICLFLYAVGVHATSTCGDQRIPFGSCFALFTMLMPGTKLQVIRLSAFCRAIMMALTVIFKESSKAR